MTASNFSCGLQSSGRLSRGFLSSCLLTAATLPPAFLSQRDNVGCVIPTSFDSAFAETRRSPTSRSTIRALNLSEYSCFTVHLPDRLPIQFISRGDNFPETGGVQVGLNALNSIYGPIVTTRLGLRYVNVIDRERISGNLGRSTSWAELVAPPFGTVPSGAADLDGTLFACEVASPIAGGGAQSVRYGLIKDTEGPPKFRLDVDRYREGPMEPGNIVASLNAFADDIFAVFMAAAGPDLLAWMSEKGNSANAL
jgi:hypothetical protein